MGKINELETKCFDSVKTKFTELALASDSSCNHYTGISSIQIFKGILVFLNPGVIGENVILYNIQDVKGEVGRGRRQTISIGKLSSNISKITP